MNNSIVGYAILGLIGAGVISAIVYHVIRFMRGTIRLTLNGTTFRGGDKITGSFVMHTKKPIEGNKLVVRLIGVEETTHYHNGKRKTNSREFYRDEVLVEEAKTYRAGAKETYNFEIGTPNTRSPEFMNSTLGQALGTAIRVLSNRSTRIKWRVEARLDAKGVDLATSKSVMINTGTII